MTTARTVPVGHQQALDRLREVIEETHKDREHFEQLFDTDGHRALESLEAANPDLTLEELQQLALDLAPELYGDPFEPPPCRDENYLPGTDAKMFLMARRLDLGLGIFSAGDPRITDDCEIRVLEFTKNERPATVRLSRRGAAV